MESSTLLYLTGNVNVQCLLFGLVILLIVRWCMTLPMYNYNLPPGPMAFPIIGNLPQMMFGADISLKMEDLRKQYGDIFRLRVGSDVFVFVCKTELILEGLVKKGDQLKGRPYWIYILAKVLQTDGITFNVGKQWKYMKKNSMSAIRDLATGKENANEKIYTETEKLCEVFQSHNGKPFSLREPMSDYSFSIIYKIIFGERIKFGEPEIEEMIADFKYFFEHVSVVVPENFFPLLRFLPLTSPMKKVMRNVEKIRSFIEMKIAEHKETFNAEAIRDFIDIHLLKHEKEPNNEFLSEMKVVGTILDVFTGGTETVATNLVWAFLFMAKYPDIQRKCREEIEQMTNLNRPVTMEDKRHMTYVAATILETQRIATVSPISAPHSAEVDTTLGGYDIPKNTVVSFVLASAHLDPDYWDNPREFRPERWIGENNELKKNVAFMPFSLGPRACAGVSLVNTEVFITFTNILQKFQLENPAETAMTTEGKQSGINYVPVNDNIRAIPL